MRRAFFFIVALLSATSSFASLPRASMLDRASEHAPAAAEPLSQTRVWASDVLAPFERPAESELTRALHQAYADLSTTNASGLGRFLSLDPTWRSADAVRPQSWNRYSYVENRPLGHTDPDGRILDTIADIGFTLYDVYDIVSTTVRNEPVSATQNAALLADLGAIVIPGVTGAGAVVRTAAHAEEAVHAVEGATHIADASKSGGELLHHLGTERKSAEKLGRKAAEAEAHIGEHGVSATTARPDKPHTSAIRSEVEKHFPVKKTGKDPNHYTVVLPKPVTDEVAELFNWLFNRK